MKQTLLEIVQDILNDLDGDEVNSITDTTEALQVAQIVKTTFYEILDGREWPHIRKVIQLQGLGDTSRKTSIKIPENVTELIWLNYDKQKVTDTQPRFLGLNYYYPDEFISQTNQRNLDSDNVEQMINPEGVPFLVLNSVAPTFWTSFDDETIVFDSYDKEVDTTIQTSKTQAYVVETPSWTMSDSFVPDLPADSFSFLIAEAKSACALKLNQVADQKAEQQSSRQRKRMSSKNFVAKGGIRYKNYGRQSKK